MSEATASLSILLYYLKLQVQSNSFMYYIHTVWIIWQPWQAFSPTFSYLQQHNSRKSNEWFSFQQLCKRLNGNPFTLTMFIYIFLCCNYFFVLCWLGSRLNNIFRGVYDVLLETASKASKASQTIMFHDMKRVWTKIAIGLGWTCMRH